MEEHILVGLSSAPSNARIIRTAATMAKAFECKCTALFVRTPDYDAMSEEDKERLRANTELANSLGAAVETVFGDDVSYQIAEYARLSNVTKIVVGRSAATRKYRWSKPTLTEKLTAIAPNLDIHIIPDASVDGSYKGKKKKQKIDPRILTRDWLLTIGILTLATVLSWGFSKVGFTEENIITVYLLAALLPAVFTSSRSSSVLSAIGGVLIFNFLFAAPRYSLRVYAHGAPLTFVIMVVAALLVSTLTVRLKNQLKQSTRAAYRTNLLLEASQMLQKASTDEKIFQTALTLVTRLVDRNAAIEPGAVMPGRKDALCYPIKTQDQVYGCVILEGSEPLEAFENSVLISILGDCALALENSQNAREKEEAKLQAENEKLRATLLRSISHDLRTPLTAISGNASMLLSGSAHLDETTRNQMYADIFEDATWLHSLVENLLAVTRIDDGRMELKTQPQLVEEIVSEAMLHIGRKKPGQTITVSHEDDLLLAKCDVRLILQVIINLVSNAIKYTQEGSAIHVSTKRAGNDVLFRVADDGPGIADSEKEAIFQMFYTGASAVADSRRSIGLGLSLCKSIVNAHGGEISVADNSPRGTVFTFTIPTGGVVVHE